MQIAAVSLKFHQRPIRSLKPQALNCFFKIGLPWIWYKQCRSNDQFICDYFPEIISPTLSLCSRANGGVRFHQVCQIIKKCCTSKFQLKLHIRVLLLLLLFFAYDSLFVSATDHMAALLHTTSSAKKAAHAHSWIPWLSTMWHLLIECFPLEHIHNLWRDWIRLHSNPSCLPRSLTPCPRVCQPPSFPQ